MEKLQQGKTNRWGEKIQSMNEIMQQVSLLDKASNEEKIEQEIPGLLAALGTYTNADRVYIFDLVTPEIEPEYYANTFEWCKDGVTPQIDQLTHVLVPKLTGWHDILRKGDTIVIEDIENIKEEMPYEYEMLKMQDIHSEIAVPLFSSNHLSGFLGLDNPDMEYGDLSVQLLSNVGGHLGCVKANIGMLKLLETKREALQESVERLAEEKNILDCLCVDYTSVYACDLLKDTLEPVKQGLLTNATETDEVLVEGKRRYSTRIQYYYDHYIIKESAPDFLEKLSAENLIKHLSDNERMAYRFRSVPNKLGQEYFEVQVVRLKSKEDEYKIVMGYRYVDDIIQEEERQKKRLEQALSELSLNNEIISAISKIYWLIYRMDLEKDIYEEVSSEDDVHRLTGHRGSVSVEFAHLKEKVVAEEYQERMTKFLDIQTLAERLQERETIDTEYLSKDGSWHMARFIAKKRNSDGKVTNVLYVVREINEQKRQELEYQEQLLKTAEEARRANVAKTDFLRRMSHDIRTPINGIHGYIEIASHYPQDLDKQRECREKIKTASGFLLDLVNNVLDMNKLESGGIQLEHKAFNLMDLLEKVNEIVEVQGKEYGVSYHIANGSIQHKELIGSPIHIQQILINVASNAVKYNREGGSVFVTCKELYSDEDTATFELTCTDTGIGMSEEFQKHLFEPFAQELDKARSNYTGTGLGLSIVKKLVEIVGGTITFESEQNKGTRFTMNLPFKINREFEEREKLKVENKDIDCSGIHVLLVEDNEMNMEIAEFLLKEKNIKVTKAYNGQEAVQRFYSSRSQEFDVILMDVMMPIMDGIEAVKVIRKMHRQDAKEIPIFAMTANAFIDDAQRSKEAGMNEHFSKPLDMEIVCATIARYCRKRK